VDLVTPTKIYTLEITTNALCAMEKRTGKTFGQLIDALRLLDMAALRALMHAVLQAHHAKEFPTEESVGSIIDSVKMKGVRAAVYELFVLNNPPEEEKKESGSTNPPEDAAAGTGANSTLTLVASG
jgi:hypothetical protein